MKPHTPVLVAFSVVFSLWFVAGPLSQLMANEHDAATNPAAVVATSVNVTIPNGGSGIVKQIPLSNKQLLALADNMYQDGVVPLGDNKYSTSFARKGSVYLCNARKSNAESTVRPLWIDGKTWSNADKSALEGEVAWRNASFSNTVSGDIRTITTFAIPVSHTTGEFPTALDENVQAIVPHAIAQKMPANPAYSEIPYCMGGEVGIMLSGVPLSSAFDAGLLDAPAHELQDRCGGHPNDSGTYHYHNLSPCIADEGVETVLGYAYDGFPITGARVADGKYLTTEDLDACHGVTSEVLIDGKRRMTYHYVMTIDFPYSAGCFRGKPASTGPSAGSFR